MHVVMGKAGRVPLVAHDPADHLVARGGGERRLGEIGALGGGLIPNAMGLSKQHTGSYLWGFVLFAICAAAMLLLLRTMQIRWTRTWAEKGGRARA